MSTSFAGFRGRVREGGVQDFERVALAAAARAGALLRERCGRRQQVSFKSAIDLVTTVDREAEGLVLETIREAFPDHGIVAEESPATPGSGDYRWYVDPLDGTTNFAHGFPQFAVSIALERGAEVIVGVVSFGDPTCTELGVDTRVDVYASAWVDPFIASADPDMILPGHNDDGCSLASRSPRAGVPFVPALLVAVLLALVRRRSVLRS